MLPEERRPSVAQRTAAMLAVVVALLLTWGLATAMAVPEEEGVPAALPAGQATAGTSGTEPALRAARDANLALSATPLPQVESMLGAVVSATLSQYVGDLSGEWPVLVGGEWYTITTRYTSSTNELLEKAAEYAGAHLASLGLDVEYHRWNPDLAPNVIGELEGALYPKEVVILCAHLDSYNQDLSKPAPGADDNASGAAAVLAAAEILGEYSWGRTLRFALWTGEERGLLGSKAYARRSSDQGEEIVGVLNLDMIGWDSSGGPDMDLHANQAAVPASLGLAELFSDVVGLYDLDLVPEIVANGMGLSDHAAFWAEGYPAILGIEDYYPNQPDFNPYWHKEQDRLQYLNLGFFTEFARAAVGTVAHLGCLVENGPCQWRFYLPLVARQE